MVNIILKLACIFYFLIKSSQWYITNIIGVACNSQIPPAICSKGYLITFCNCSKGNQTPFCKLQEGIRLPHAILFDFRGFFGFCMRYLIPFCKLQKRNLIPFRAGTKGGEKPFQMTFCISLLHGTILYL